MRFDIITIFPGFFAGVFDHGIVKRALAADLIQIEIHDLRSFTHDRHRTVDDRPFGGGEGMVLKPEPLVDAVESLRLPQKSARNGTPESVILLSAQGAKFTQATARELAKLERAVLICGRYEGVDERVNQLVCDRELSIGDYVLSGGELGAAVIVDATMRLVPGALGNQDSSAFESFGQSDEHFPADSDSPPRSTHGSGGILDYPHYTRPAEFRGLAVPEVLAGGDHAAIRRWRRERALEKTLRNRPDLLEAADLSREDRAFLAALARQTPDFPVN
ncbi:MAG: tRNA (guanosine(37)-N1)-methyltransferase TrmD [Silvibacterium sp.]|nr:tRNA (guanosine(37)-N1)-methyltransferase TrmD [Silvibacterium sp.]